mgnify:CR=1 FL=1
MVNILSGFFILDNWLKYLLLSFLGSCHSNTVLTSHLGYFSIDDIYWKRNISKVYTMLYECIDIYSWKKPEYHLHLLRIKGFFFWKINISVRDKMVYKWIQTRRVQLFVSYPYYLVSTNLVFFAIFQWLFIVKESLDFLSQSHAVCYY